MVCLSWEFRACWHWYSFRVYHFRFEKHAVSPSRGSFLRKCQTGCRLSLPVVMTWDMSTIQTNYFWDNQQTLNSIADTHPWNKCLESLIPTCFARKLQCRFPYWQMLMYNHQTSSLMCVRPSGQFSPILVCVWPSGQFLPKFVFHLWWKILLSLHLPFLVDTWNVCLRVGLAHD